MSGAGEMVQQCQGSFHREDGKTEICLPLPPSDGGLRTLKAGQAVASTSSGPKGLPVNHDCHAPENDGIRPERNYGINQSSAKKTASRFLNQAVFLFLLRFLTCADHASPNKKTAAWRLP
jgi:hypothetical protein